MNKGFEKTEGENILTEKEPTLDSYDNETNNTISNIGKIVEPLSNSSFLSLKINDSNKINQTFKRDDITDDEKKTNANIEIYTGLIGKILSSNKNEENSNGLLNISSPNSNNKDESDILVKNEKMSEEKEFTLSSVIDNIKDPLEHIEFKEDKEKSEINELSGDIFVDNIESENKNNENPQDTNFEKTETLISEGRSSYASNTKNYKNNKNKKKKRKNKI